MAQLKERVLREYGDHGAETLKRYVAQLKYTAYWCIRMLRDEEQIEAVISEGIEDTVIVRKNIYELHQIKTRDEGRGPWTFSEVLPILCQQYNRRRAFSNCRFHFVSNQIADNNVQKKNGGSLCNLKFLLDIKHNGEIYNSRERDMMDSFERNLAPVIQEIMLEKYKEMIDFNTAISLLYSTKIETESTKLYNPENSTELDLTFYKLFPGIPPYTLRQLEDICENIIFLVLKKTIETLSLKERHIYRDDVLNCRNTIVDLIDSDEIDWNTKPGRTKLDKKTLYGGFDSFEIRRFHRQKLQAEYFMRSYTNVGMEKDLQRLRGKLLEYQAECRDTICRQNGIKDNPGPRILSELKSKLENIILEHNMFPKTDLDPLICLGLIWHETNECYAAWHSLND